MNVKPGWLAATALVVLLAGETVFACHTCKQTPCVLAPPCEPAFECVTEMVPFTVMKTKTRVDLVPVCTRTVMEKKIDIEYDVQTRTACKPVFDTVVQTRCVTVCRPVCETSMVCQPYTVCRPVTTTRQVTEYCRQPNTELVTVPVKNRCHRCGHSEGGCTCMTVARTCYRRVPVVREVTETHMVSEVQTRMVPVVRWRMVTEQKTEQVPVTVCRMVNQVIHVKVPRMVIHCEPKQQVYKTAVVTCEEVPVTVYRPVTRMVPVVVPSAQSLPSAQRLPGPSEKPGAFAPPPAPPPAVERAKPEGDSAPDPKKPKAPPGPPTARST